MIAKTKVLSIICILLLICNFIMLYFMFGSDKPHGNHKMPREVIIDKLNFSNDQVIKYDKLIAWHQENSIQEQKVIHHLKDLLYETLPDTGLKPQRDSLILVLGKEQMKLEEINYHHFEDIKKLCKDDQLPKFADLTREMSRLFAPPPMKKR